MKSVIIVFVVLMFLTACAPSVEQLSTQTAVSLATSKAAWTQTSTPTKIPTSTSTPTITPSPTLTPTPTPFGGGSGQYDFVIFSDTDSQFDSQLVSSSGNTLTTKKDIEQKLGKTFGFAYMSLSQNGEKLLLATIRCTLSSPCVNVPWRFYVSSGDFLNLHELNVPQGIYYWEWSPDGARIGFWQSTGGSAALYGIDSNGKNLARIASGYQTDSPFWAGDSSKVFFTSNCKMYSANPDGTDEAQINLDQFGYDKNSCLHLENLKYSPDSQEIAFWISYTLFITNANFTQPIKVNPPSCDPGQGNRNRIVWSNDGKYVAVSCFSDIYPTTSFPSKQIGASVIVEIKTGTVLNISTVDSFICGWTPDNKQIVFIKDNTITFLDLASNTRINIKASEGKSLNSNSCPVWLP